MCRGGTEQCAAAQFSPAWYPVRARLFFTFLSIYLPTRGTCALARKSVERSSSRVWYSCTLTP